MRSDVDQAYRIAEDARDRITESIAWPARGALSDASYAGAEARRDFGASLGQRLNGLDRSGLPPALDDTLALIEERAQNWRRAADWYWTVFDPWGGDMFAMFAPTAYCLGMVSSSVSSSLAHAPLSNEGDRARYLAGLHDYARFLEQLLQRTREQVAKGVFMPRAQADSARALLDRLKRQQPSVLAISEERSPGKESFRAETVRIASERVGGALERFEALLDARYFANTSEDVGLMHYPQGEEIYAALVRHHGSTNLSPAEVHEYGLERMEAVREAMAAVRREARFDGDDRAYRDALDGDPRWRARTPDEIASVFQRYIDRFTPELERLFRIKPRADYGVRALPDALAASMTFGYYDAPRPDKPRGDYVFNARNLAQSGLYKVAALTFHELAPGHHLHLALQGENASLSSLRRFLMPTAYVEGWAEYAVTLAEESGMFQEPAERFGRLLSEAFLVSRLVVDTGLNALGWSLDKARAYMRENSFFPEAEIASETLRYSSDIPGQALAYKLGERALLDMRARMQAALGARFDIRDFHDAVLSAGAVPLPRVDSHLQTATRAILATSN